MPEPGDRLIHGPFQHVGDGETVHPDVEHLAGEAASAAHVAGYEDIGEEHHFHLHVPGALAGVAPAALEIEGEGGRRVPTRAGQRLGRRPLDAITRLTYKRAIHLIDAPRRA